MRPNASSLISVSLLGLVAPPAGISACGDSSLQGAEWRFPVEKADGGPLEGNPRPAAGGVAADALLPGCDPPAGRPDGVCKT
jgi:hypothetical protein